MQTVGLLHPVVGEEGDVDDGVVAERVEEHDVLLRPLQGGAVREVPIGRRAASTGLGGDVAVRRELVRDDGLTTDHLDDDAGLGCRDDVGDPDTHFFAWLEVHTCARPER